MKNGEVLNLLHILNQQDFSELKSFKFHYAVIKNINALTAEKIAIDKAIEQMKPAEFKALMDELRPLVLPLIEGKPESRFTAIQNEFVAGWEKRDEWLKAVSEVNQLVAQVYEEESSFSPHLISLDTLDSLPLTASQVAAIMPFVNNK